MAHLLFPLLFFSAFRSPNLSRQSLRSPDLPERSDDGLLLKMAWMKSSFSSKPVVEMPKRWTASFRSASFFRRSCSRVNLHSCSALALLAARSSLTSPFIWYVRVLGSTYTHLSSPIRRIYYSTITSLHLFRSENFSAKETTSLKDFKSPRKVSCAIRSSPAQTASSTGNASLDNSKASCETISVLLCDQEQCIWQ